MWNRRGERLKILEEKLPIDYRNAAISEIETQVMILLKESQGFGLLPWQVAVVKILYIGILVELKLRNRWSFWMNVFMIGSLLLKTGNRRWTQMYKTGRQELSNLCLMIKNMLKFN